MIIFIQIKVFELFFVKNPVYDFSIIMIKKTKNKANIRIYWQFCNRPGFLLRFSSRWGNKNRCFFEPALTYDSFRFP